MTDTVSADEVHAVRWYHSIPLPGGMVTPGEYDLGPVLHRLPLPESLAGFRCLDVGTHDGFWAFEMERRDAAEVVAIDIDDPTRLDWPEPRPELDDATLAALAERRRAFAIAHAALGSSVRRLDLSVYELDPAAVGEFDFAVLGTLLHHLRDPVGALAAVRRVVRGPLLLLATFSLSKTVVHPRRPVAELLATGLPFWEVPNLAALGRQVTAAGWDVLRMGRPFLERYGPGWVAPHLSLRPGDWKELPRRAVLRFGAPHVWVLARPSASVRRRRRSA